MGPERRRHLGVVEIGSVRRDSQNVHRFPKPSSDFSDCSRQVEEPTAGGRLVASEHKELETGIGWEKILQIHGPKIGGANEHMGRHPLADKDILGALLMSDIDDWGFCVLNADTTGESAECLERFQKLRVGDAAQVYFRARLARKEFGKLDVEVYEILGVLSPLKLVLQ
jgi:hypothetical protein